MMRKAFLILAEIAKSEKGLELLIKYGFLEFGVGYVKNLKNKKLNLIKDYEEI